MIKEGNMEEADVSDAYFATESLELGETELIASVEEVSYEEIGFQLGLRGEKEFKDNFIERFKTLYEGDLNREQELVKKLESNLNNQLGKLEVSLQENLNTLAQKKKSISLFELMILDFMDSEDANNDLQTSENKFLDDIISRRYKDVDRQNETINQLKEKISSINSKLDSLAEMVDKDIADLKAENWRNKVLKTVEEIEKGFAFGYAQRLQNKEK